MPSSGADRRHADAALDFRITKAPPWHGWVTADLALNSFSTGIFAVTALCDVVAPSSYAGIVRAGYLVAFPLAVLDLLCLVVDLGDPLRFLNMLRVFKPRSPMSLGAWSTNVFALFASLAWLWAFFAPTRFHAARILVAVPGLAAALVTASYKGVLFSATAQPGWKEARWLGAEFALSSGTLGIAFALAVAAFAGALPALEDLRAALTTLLALDFVAVLAVAFEMRGALAVRFTADELRKWYGGLIGGGIIAPMLLIVLSRSAAAAIAAAALVLIAAPPARYHLVAIAQRERPTH